MSSKVLQFHHSTLAFDEVNDCISDMTLVKTILSVFNKRPESIGKVGKLHDLPWERSFTIEKHLVTVRRCISNELFRPLPLYRKCQRE